MNKIKTKNELKRLSEAQLCVLLDQAYQDLIAARPASPAYYAALTSYENIYAVLNQKLTASWINATRP